MLCVIVIDISISSISFSRLSFHTAVRLLPHASGHRHLSQQSGKYATEILFDVLAISHAGQRLRMALEAKARSLLNRCEAWEYDAIGVVFHTSGFKADFFLSDPNKSFTQKAGSNRSPDSSILSAAAIDPRISAAAAAFEEHMNETSMSSAGDGRGAAKKSSAHHSSGNYNLCCSMFRSCITRVQRTWLRMLTPSTWPLATSLE